jgi:serine/threonine protein kinase
MKTIKNKFSCEFLGKANDEENYYIFMKLYDTDLQTLLDKNYVNGMEINNIKLNLSQLNIAFKKMHENNIIHRDIKPNNILIEYTNERNKFNVVLSDFGLGKYLNDETYLTMGLGTFMFMAPEIMNMENNYSDKVDLYSLGITILCMLKKEINIKEIYKGNIPQTNNKLLNELLSKMLEFNPDKRISWNEYFNHKFFLYNEHQNLIDDYISKITDENNNIIIDNRITIKEEIKLIICGKKNNYDVIKYYDYYSNNCPKCDSGYGGAILSFLRRTVSKYDGRGSGIICHNCGYGYYFK